MTEESYLSYYQAGKKAFEGGHYRQSISDLESAIKLVEPMSPHGGDIQIWLVTAYQAANRLPEALSLVRKLTHHPNLEIRQQSKQLLYIMEAPRLQRPPEWMTEIPDLTKTTEENKLSLLTPVAGQSQKSSKNTPTPIETSPKVIVKDNSFLWVALTLFLLVIGKLVLFDTLS